MTGPGIWWGKHGRPESGTDLEITTSQPHVHHLVTWLPGKTRRSVHLWTVAPPRRAGNYSAIWKISYPFCSPPAFCDDIVGFEVQDLVVFFRPFVQIVSSLPGRVQAVPRSFRRCLVQFSAGEELLPQKSPMCLGHCLVGRWTFGPPLRGQRSILWWSITISSWQTNKTQPTVLMFSLTWMTDWTEILGGLKPDHIP